VSKITTRYKGVRQDNKISATPLENNKAGTNNVISLLGNREVDLLQA
jgi:hypothetical protein